jgi:hypothetical protein
MDSLEAIDRQDIEQTAVIVDCMKAPESHALHILLPKNAIRYLQPSNSVLQHSVIQHRPSAERR